jgi:ActR/RegA family two-component response regulator
MSGFESRGVYNHSSALSVAREFQPDIFITGFNNSSEKNGCETAIDILMFLPQCRVIILSGHPPTAKVLNDNRQSGYHFEVIVKPANTSDLIAKLRAHEHLSTM